MRRMRYGNSSRIPTLVLALGILPRTRSTLHVRERVRRERALQHPLDHRALLLVADGAGSIHLVERAFIAVAEAAAEAAAQLSAAVSGDPRRRHRRRHCRLVLGRVVPAEQRAALRAALAAAAAAATPGGEVGGLGHLEGEVQTDVAVREPSLRDDVDVRREEGRQRLQRDAARRLDQEMGPLTY